MAMAILLENANEGSESLTSWGWEPFSSPYHEAGRSLLDIRQYLILLIPVAGY
jgi:hypothetical protein